MPWFERELKMERNTVELLFPPVFEKPLPPIYKILEPGPRVFDE